VGQRFVEHDRVVVDELADFVREQSSSIGVLFARLCASRSSSSIRTVKALS